LNLGLELFNLVKEFFLILLLPFDFVLQLSDFGTLRTRSHWSFERLNAAGSISSWPLVFDATHPVPVFFCHFHGCRSLWLGLHWCLYYRFLFLLIQETWFLGNCVVLSLDKIWFGSVAELRFYALLVAKGRHLVLCHAHWFHAS